MSNILKMQKMSKKNRFFENFTQVDPLNDEENIGEGKILLNSL